MNTWLRKIACLVALVCPTTAAAQGTIAAAERAYLSEAYADALDQLTNLPGILEIAPIFDQVRGEDREQILFDLARCRFALFDSVGADLVIRELFRNDPGQAYGVMDLQKDDALTQVLASLKLMRRVQMQERINETSPLKGAVRSLVVPGWGQIYRGRRSRGRIIAGGFAVLAAGWYLADRSYRTALNEYSKTSERDLNLPARTGGANDPNPFDDRFATVESRASTARTLGLALVSVWSYSVIENLIVQPGRVALQIPLD
ncbi:MAG TPA: hypothetical protein DHW45_10335 [Candidatus Latescibacteria bacterium]|nr:hypothetical protein [Candidatus Latescibacterota bacterium]